ncbi:MAG: serine hydrolase domain-containing protein [Hyphomonadaceae bacterium]
MRGVRVLLAFACLFLAASCTKSVESDPFARDLQTTLDHLRDQHGFPGITAAVAWPDGRLVAAASGWADVEAKRPMSPDTPMLAASIGKSFVAAIVLSLESGGLISRSDRVEDYLGDRPWFGCVPNAHTMTIGQLLRHQSGLPDHVDLPAFQAAFAARNEAGGDPFSPEELIGFVCDSPALFDAGTSWSYSDTGYILLGLVVEQATRRSYYDVLQERLLDPLKLDASHPSNTRAIPGLAVGYVDAGNGFGLPTRSMGPDGVLVWDPSTEWTGGGLVSTSGDLARWGDALFGGEALPAPYLDRLLDAVPVSADDPGVSYGAGVAIYADTPRGPVYGHAGWIPGYVSSLRCYRDAGVCVAFQINTDRPSTSGQGDTLPAVEAALADIAMGRFSAPE